MKYIHQINRFKPENLKEENDKRVILDYINTFKNNMLTRENELAHLTCSGFIMNEEFTKVLMIHHNIYKTWAWTGGHADGEEDTLKTAIKEAIEETGIQKFTPLSHDIASIDILPVWSHYKGNQYISTHLHLNVSYILIADEQARLIVNQDETSGVKWIKIEEIENFSNEPKLIAIYKRLIKKSLTLRNH